MQSHKLIFLSAAAATATAATAAASAAASSAATLFTFADRRRDSVSSSGDRWTCQAAKCENWHGLHGDLEVWSMQYGARGMGHGAWGILHRAWGICIISLLWYRIVCFASFRFSFLFVLPFLRSTCGVDGDASEMLPPFPPCKQKE